MFAPLCQTPGLRFQPVIIPSLTVLAHLWQDGTPERASAAVSPGKILGPKTQQLLLYARALPKKSGYMMYPCITIPWDCSTDGFSSRVCSSYGLYWISDQNRDTFSPSTASPCAHHIPIRKPRSDVTSHS